MADLEQRVRWADRTDRNIGPLEFFRQNYDGQGVTRNGLSGLDSTLYKCLLSQHLIDEAIPDKITPRRPGRFGGDPLNYYFKNYPGATRGRLRVIDGSLYVTLHRLGLLESVPTVNNRFGSNPLDYYRTHYAGMTRNELANRDQSLYNKLCYDGLVSLIPRKNRSFGGDPLGYYFEHYNGVTRGRLEIIDKSLYNALSDKGLLVSVPTVKSGVVSNIPRRERRDFLGDPLGYYQRHYPGVSRGRLARKDSSLYQALKHKGMLVNVPTRAQLEHEKEQAQA